MKLSEIEITKPKPNIPKSERKAIRKLKENSEININKADKGTHHCHNEQNGQD